MWCNQTYHCTKQIPWIVNELAFQVFGIDTDLLPSAAAATAPSGRVAKWARAVGEVVMCGQVICR
jgi:hypothetical protein